jgi:hypothetical protein
MIIIWEKCEANVRRIGWRSLVFEADTLNRREYKIGPIRTDMSTLKTAFMSDDFPEPLYH